MPQVTYAPEVSQEPQGAIGGTLYVLGTRSLGAPLIGNPFSAPVEPISIYVEPVVPDIQEMSEPEPPALPFRFVGTLESGRRWLVQLERAGEVLLVGDGETIDGLYRVEGFEEDQFVLTYLPLDRRQALSTVIEQ
ncbi:MAG TPA: hypothetical protein VGE57_09045 [Solimonas sp.]